MSAIDSLLNEYASLAALPWEQRLAGPQRVWFVVYEPASERRIRLRLPDFERRTVDVGHDWHHVDLTHAFGEWMAAHEYRDGYFDAPDDMSWALEDFERHIAASLRSHLRAHDEHAVVAITGLATLFGLTHVSTLIESVTSDVRGRLVAFFPGQYVQNTYRLLDARDGWNYLAIPIVAREAH